MDLGIFGGAMASVEGLNDELDKEIIETPEDDETRESYNSEGVEYSETDIERIEAAADVMGEIFTDEVISNWGNLSVEERTAYLDEYYAAAGEALGIGTKGVRVEDLQEKYGPNTQGVNSGDGYIGIDISIVEDPSMLAELLDTATHEMRHQLQNDALKNPDAFPDIPQETLDQWQYELNHYISPSYDFEDYQSQAIETDARAFAEEVVDEFISDIDDGTYSVERHESENAVEVISDDELTDGEAELMSAQEGAETDGLDSAENVSDTPEAKSEVVQADGIEVEEDLNKNTFSYTPGQCARISTGTQNYCPFAGSGR